MTYTPQPMRLDLDAAKASEVEQIVANLAFTFSQLIRLLVGDTTLGTLVANLGFDEFDEAVIPSLVLSVTFCARRAKSKELRASWSPSDARIVIFIFDRHIQRDHLVCHCGQSALLRRVSGV
jgi:hypothetical protein